MPDGIDRATRRGEAPIHADNSFSLSRASETLLMFHLTLTCRRRNHCQPVRNEHSWCVSKSDYHASDIEVKTTAEGALVYLCRTCTDYKGEEKLFTTKTYLHPHGASADHQLAVQSSRAEALRREELQYEAELEAIPVQALSFSSLPPVNLAPRRPTFSTLNDELPLETGFVDHLNDVHFDTGQYILENLGRPRVRSAAIQYAIDKYGYEADDMDITVTSVVDNLRRIGKIHHNPVG